MPGCKTVLCWLGAFVISCQVQAQTIVVPNSLTNVPGNTANGIPFGSGFFRYQQVYASSEFSSSGGLIIIHHIAFRPDESISVPFSASFPNLQVNLSTTSAAVDLLSTTFASNTGTDEQIVFQGTWSILSNATGSPTRLFDVVLTFQSSFLYNPAMGNLLLDIRQNSNVSTSMFDGEFTSGDGVSRMFGAIGNPTGSADSLGLVTQFGFTAVPEPRLWLLCVCIAVSGVSLRWVIRRRQSI